MRCAAYLSLVAAAVAVVSRADDPKKRDPFEEALKECVSWTKTSERVVKLKIDQEKVIKDFDEIAKTVGRDFSEYGKLASKFKSEYSRPDSADDFRELFVAIWFTWRIGGVDGLKRVLDNLDDFVLVKIVSDPKGAKIIVDGVPRGETPRPLYLNRNGKFNITISKDGYEPTEMKEYSPPVRGETVEKSLKKK